MRTNYDQSDIEIALEQLVLDLGISSNVFYSTRPKTTDTPMNDFIIVRVVGSIEDLNVYGETMIAIDLFAKDLTGNLKNSKKLSLMQSKLFAGTKHYVKLPNNNGNMMIKDFSVLSDYSDTFGFHARVINSKVLLTINN